MSKQTLSTEELMSWMRFVTDSAEEVAGVTAAIDGFAAENQAFLNNNLMDSVRELNEDLRQSFMKSKEAFEDQGHQMLASLKRHEEMTDRASNSQILGKTRG